MLLFLYRARVAKTVTFKITLPETTDAYGVGKMGKERGGILSVRWKFCRGQGRGHKKIWVYGFRFLIILRSISMHRLGFYSRHGLIQNWFEPGKNLDISSCLYRGIEFWT